MSDERESRALAYIQECISLMDRDVFTMADATTKLSDELKARHLEIDWQAIRGFRNLAAHVYERLRLQQVRAIVTDALPPLKAVVEAELAALRRDR